MRKKVCKYFPCDVARESGRDCADFETCQTYKFYQRYGTEPLYVGAMTVSPKRIITKELVDKLFKEDMRDF